MKKDKEWLKENVSSILYRAELRDAFVGTSVGNIIYDEIEAVIDQLDEPEKPVIPQKIADFIEKSKQKCHSLAYALNSTESIKWVSEKHRDEWLYSNERENLFARAWLDGYEVEKEKRYCVKFPSGHFLYRTNSEGNLSYLRDIYQGNPDIYLFTEQEIKAIDERYWAFAEEVTE